MSEQDIVKRFNAHNYPIEIAFTSAGYRVRLLYAKTEHIFDTERQMHGFLVIEALRLGFTLKG